MKLVQKQLFRGRREVEIVGDTVSFRVKTGLSEDSLTVDLRMVNPEPVVNGPLLEFHSRVKCDPLITLLIDKPDAETFNAFVDELRQRARQEYNAFAGLRSGNLPAAMAVNVFDEPPNFDEPAKGRAEKKSRPVRIEDIDISIEMLQRHLDTADIEPVLDALRALRQQPDKEACFTQLVEAFEGLGPRQGAVLTYAPYVGLLLSDDPFG